MQNLNIEDICEYIYMHKHLVNYTTIRLLVGGGFRMGNTCKSMAYSCQCMAKTTTIL